MLAREGHGFAVDWWGLGALLFEMLTGLPPWYSRDRQKMFSSIRNEPLVIPSYVAAEIQTLIAGLLEKDPKRRLGGQGSDAAEIKAHSIFRYVGWDQLYQKRVIPPWKPGDTPGGTPPASAAQKVGGAVGNSDGVAIRDVAFSPDTSNFEDTFTQMPVQSVGSEVSCCLFLFETFFEPPHAHTPLPVAFSTPPFSLPVCPGCFKQHA